MIPIPTWSFCGGNSISDICKISTNWLFTCQKNSLIFSPTITQGLSACSGLWWLHWTSTTFFSSRKFSSCCLSTVRFSCRGPFPHFSIILDSPIVHFLSSIFIWAFSLLHKVVTLQVLGSQSIQFFNFFRTCFVNPW